MKTAFAYKILRTVLEPAFILVFRPRIIGAENIPKDGRVVIAGNHKHALDPILVDVSTKRVVCTLAKKELHDSRFGFFFRAVGTIPVDLNSAKNHAALESAIEALNSDRAVNVSPEAKRNYTDELLLQFKFGAVSMASRTGAPIVPYAITGDYKPFSGHPTIVIGKPFYPSGDLETANEELYNRIARLLKFSMSDAEYSTKKFTPYKEHQK